MKIILLDGFDWSFLRRVPFLMKILKHSQYAKIESSPLFQEAYTFWLGRYPTLKEMKNPILKIPKKTFLDFLPPIDFVHELAVDKIAHYQPEKLSEYFKHLDKKLKRLLENENEFIVCSDHGMKKVKKKINIRPYLKKKYKRYIIGATIAYIFHKKSWFPLYADDGEVFVPNNFEDNLEMAHGWLRMPTYCPFIYHKKGQKKKYLGEHKIIDVAPTICKILGVDYNAEGKNFIQNKRSD